MAVSDVGFSPCSVRKPGVVAAFQADVSGRNPRKSHDSTSPATVLGTPWRFKSSHPHSTPEQAFASAELSAAGSDPLVTLPVRGRPAVVDVDEPVAVVPTDAALVSELGPQPLRMSHPLPRTAPRVAGVGRDGGRGLVVDVLAVESSARERVVVCAMAIARNNRAHAELRAHGFQV